MTDKPTGPVLRRAETLGDLERAGTLPKELIGHYNEVYPAGWRHLTLAEDIRLTDERLSNLRAEVREFEDDYIASRLRIRAAQDRRDEIERLQRSPGEDAA
jgi:hypothetical protein